MSLTIWPFGSLRSMQLFYWVPIEHGQFTIWSDKWSLLGREKQCTFTFLNSFSFPHSFPGFQCCAIILLGYLSTKDVLFTNYSSFSIESLMQIFGIPLERVQTDPLLTVLV